jgi:AcrR family transcriptional regulator
VTPRPDAPRTLSHQFRAVPSNGKRKARDRKIDCTDPAAIRCVANCLMVTERNPDERREMIVAAALPLLVEQGAAVSTAQIAKAAGIGEATIFRSLRRQERTVGCLCGRCSAQPHVLAELDAVVLDQP